MAKFRISGVPIVDETGKLIGIITNRDMKFRDRYEPPHRRGHDQDEGLSPALSARRADEAKAILLRTV